MKKHVFSFLLLGLCAGSVSAQTVQLKAGLVASAPGVNPEIGNQSYRTGMLAGIAYESPLDKVFSIQPELLFVQKGEKREGSGIRYQSRINYLEMPVLLKLNLPLRKAKLYVNAGPSFSYALGGTQTLGGFGLTGNSDLTFGDKENELKAIDVGLQIGGGLSIKHAGGAFLVDLRYGHGITNLRNVDNADYKNRVFTLAVGYALPL